MKTITTQAVNKWIKILMLITGILLALFIVVSAYFGTYYSFMEIL